jgi:hypothetical protein
LLTLRAKLVTIFAHGGGCLTGQSDGGGRGIMSDTLEFHLREYSALRDELLEKTRQIDQSMRLMLVGLPALLSWIILQGSTLGRVEAAVAAWIPFLSMIFFAGHRKDLAESIKRIALYLRKLEKSFGDQDLGWEGRGTEDEIIKGQGYFLYSKRTQILLLVFTFVFGVWRTVFFALKDIVSMPF